jgi:succinate dehydrogenase / fumarate reductase flavoprotein subunit
LSDTFVFGYRAGIAAADEARSRAAPDAEAGNWRAALNALQDRVTRPVGALSPTEWRRAVQSLVVSSIGQVRHADRLNAALAKLDEFERVFEDLGAEGETLRERCESVRLDLETRNLIQVARMLGTAALQRNESRGGHFRLDFPAIDDRFTGNIVLWQDGGKLKHELRPVPSAEDEAPPPAGVTSTKACLV